MLCIDNVHINRVAGFFKRVKNGAEVFPFIAAYQPRDILKHDPLGVRPFDDLHCVEEQTAASSFSRGVGQACPLARHGYILTGTPEHNHVDAT